MAAERGGQRHAPSSPPSRSLRPAEISRELAAASRERAQRCGRRSAEKDGAASLPPPPASPRRPLPPPPASPPGGCRAPGRSPPPSRCCWRRPRSCRDPPRRRTVRAAGRRGGRGAVGAAGYFGGGCGGGRRSSGAGIRCVLPPGPVAGGRGGRDPGFCGNPPRVFGSLRGGGADRAAPRRVPPHPASPEAAGKMEHLLPPTEPASAGLP